MIYCSMDTRIGRLTVTVSEVGVRRILWAGEEPPPGAWSGTNDLLDSAIAQLQEYFAGQRTNFELPLDLGGTAFQQKVWLALATIPFGTTISYAEQARRIGNPRAVRAVGSANGRNPVPIILPCHRVIGSNGALTGFGGGLGVKRILLDHEANLLSPVP